MAATIDATVGGSDANSYVTLSAADDFFETQPLSTAWDDATDDEKNRALIAATLRLDQEGWEGTPADPLTGTSEDDTQALQWPRKYATDQNGRYYLSTIIPEPVKRATYKLAYAMLDDEEFLAETGLEGFKRAKVGPMDVTPRVSRSPGELPADVYREIGYLLESSGLTFPMVRG